MLEGKWIWERVCLNDSGGHNQEAMTTRGWYIIYRPMTWHPTDAAPKSLTCTLGATLSVGCFRLGAPGEGRWCGVSTCIHSSGDPPLPLVLFFLSFLFS